jgi:hypothetical protein
MSKTPYEIRLELLTLAKEILQAPVYEKRNKLSDEYHSKLTDANRDSLPFPTNGYCGRGRSTQEVCRPSVKNESPKRGFLMVVCF